MRKLIEKTVLFLLIVCAASVSSVQAALVNGSVLSIDAGSNFGLDGGGGSFIYVDIFGHDGLITGTTQAATGAHAGAPDGSESPGIDQPWDWFGNTGMHWTSSPTNVLNSTGNTAHIDFSGWNVTWNDEPMIPLGEGAWGANPEGVAVITCGVDCSIGDSYSLYYSATVPSTAPGAFALVAYELNLVGTIQAVPLPAAFWLFMSGILALSATAKRNKLR